MDTATAIRHEGLAFLGSLADGSIAGLTAQLYPQVGAPG